MSGASTDAFLSLSCDDTAIDEVPEFQFGKFKAAIPGELVNQRPPAVPLFGSHEALRTNDDRRRSGESAAAARHDSRRLGEPSHSNAADVENRRSAHASRQEPSRPAKAVTEQPTSSNRAAHATANLDAQMKKLRSVPKASLRDVFTDRPRSGRGQGGSALGGPPNVQQPGGFSPHSSTQHESRTGARPDGIPAPPSRIDVEARTNVASTSGRDTAHTGGDISRDAAPHHLDAGSGRGGPSASPRAEPASVLTGSQLASLDISSLPGLVTSLVSQTQTQREVFEAERHELHGKLEDALKQVQQLQQDKIHLKTTATQCISRAVNALERAYESKQAFEELRTAHQTSLQELSSCHDGIRTIRQTFADLVGGTDGGSLGHLLSRIQSSFSAALNEARESTAALTQAQQATRAERERASQALYDRATAVDEIETLKKQQAESQEKLVTAQQSAHEVQIQLHEANNELKRIEDLQKLANEKDRRIEELQQQIGELAQRVESQAAEIKKKQAQHDELVTKHQELWAQHAELKAAESKATASLAETQSIKQELSQRVEALDKAKSDLEKQGVLAEETNKRIGEELTKTKGQAEVMQRFAEERRVQLETVTKQLAEKQEQLTKLVEDLGRAETKAKEGEQSSEQLQEAREAEKRSKETAEGLCGEVTLAKTELEQAKQTLEDQRKELETGQTRRAALEAEVTALKQQEREASRKKERDASEESELERVRRSLDQTERDRAQISQALERLKETNKDLASRVRLLEEQRDETVDKHQKQVEELQSALEEAKQAASRGEVDSGVAGPDTQSYETAPQSLVERYQKGTLDPHTEAPLIAHIHENCRSSFSAESARKDNEIKRLETERKMLEGKLGKAQRELLALQGQTQATSTISQATLPPRQTRGFRPPPPKTAVPAKRTLDFGSEDHTSSDPPGNSMEADDEDSMQFGADDYLGQAAKRNKGTLGASKRSPIGRAPTSTSSRAPRTVSSAGAMIPAGPPKAHDSYSSQYTTQRKAAMAQARSYTTASSNSQEHDTDRGGL